MNIDIEEMKQEIEKNAVKIPQDLQIDINMLITGHGEMKIEDKTEAHLRRDQLKLRNALDRLNSLLNEILEREIKEEKTHMF